MFNKRLSRILGGMLLLNGASLLFLGGTYLRRPQGGTRRSSDRSTLTWLTRRSGWLLRGAGAAEVGVGLAALVTAPVEVRPLYRVFSRVYDAVAFLWRDWLYSDAQRALEQAFATYLPAGGRVLDLGCGTGLNLERMLAAGLPLGFYVGVDLSEAMLHQARARFGNEARAQFHGLNLLTDPLLEGPFDLIISTWVFEHLPDPQQVVAKAWERLRPDGHMVLFFETTGDSRGSRAVGYLWRWFSARLVPEAEARRFPGFQSMTLFQAALAPMALVILHKSPQVTRSTVTEGAA